MSTELSDLKMDWADHGSAFDVAHEYLSELANDKAKLSAMVANSITNPELKGMNERHLLLDKLVLDDSKSNGLRLRLHVFRETDIDRPHDHRFPFASYILKGGYKHTVFQKVESDGKRIAKLDSAHLSYHGKGDCYVLSDKAIHAAETAQGTVSLMLRGPSEKEKSIIVDRAKNRIIWKHGASSEQRTVSSKYQMSDDSSMEVVRFLIESKIIDKNVFSYQADYSINKEHC